MRRVSTPASPSMQVRARSTACAPKTVRRTVRSSRCCQAAPRDRMPFEPREAAVRDVAELAALHVETFRETHGGGPPVSLREHQWQQILGANDPNDFTFVVEDDSRRLVAFAR